MTDLDTRIKDLINSAVDHELDGHRTAPPLDRARLAERSEPARPHPVALWRVPVLAASVAALLAVGTVLAISSDRDRRSNRLGPASPTPSVSRSTDPAQDAAARAYAEAVAGAREASEVAGVSDRPVSAKDAVTYADAGAWIVLDVAPETPEPGKSYPITVRYVVGPSTGTNANVRSDEVTVVSGELRDVAGGSCPQPFLARRAHTYLIHCQVTLRAGVHGTAAFLARSPGGTTGASFNLTDLTSSEKEEALHAYSEAVASAPEASKVAGVSERAASADEPPAGEGFGTPDGPIARPEPGRSYPLTLLYIPSSDAPAISVLAVRFEDVAASRCPPAFRIRPAHDYLIRCEVTFRAGAAGMAYFDVTEPGGRRTSGMGVSSQ